MKRGAIFNLASSLILLWLILSGRLGTEISRFSEDLVNNRLQGTRHAKAIVRDAPKDQDRLIESSSVAGYTRHFEPSPAPKRTYRAPAEPTESPYSSQAKNLISP